MTKVEYFDINANNVNSVTSIYVSDNNKEKLTKVLASSFTKNLLELDLSGCKNLKGKLPVAKCKNLKKLYIKDTQISNIDSVHKCYNLEDLYLQLEQIIYINPDELEKLSNIKYLELYDPIINFRKFININNNTVIFNNNYLDLPNLSSLILHHTSFSYKDTNWISFYERLEIFEYIFEILSHCNNLKILKINFANDMYNNYAQFNNLKFIHKLESLEELELTNCKIRNISNLSKLKNLKKLTISRNSIEKAYILDNIEISVI